MPAPGPCGIEPGENWPRGLLVYEWSTGNKRHRRARAQRIFGNARFGMVLQALQ